MTNTVIELNEGSEERERRLIDLIRNAPDRDAAISQAFKLILSVTQQHPASEGSSPADTVSPV